MQVYNALNSRTQPRLPLSNGGDSSLEHGSQGYSTGQPRARELRLDLHSRAPVQDATTLEHIRRLEDELHRAQMELSALRNHLQPRETIIPAEAIGDFRRINKMVKDISRTLAESILSQKFSGVTNPTTLDMAKSVRSSFAAAIGGCDRHVSLVMLGTGQGRPLDDVFEYGLRSIINRRLFTRIFRPFHPSLQERRTVNQEFCSVYRQMREHKSQVVSGMWRANTFSVLDKDIDSRKIDGLVHDLLDHCSNALRILKGSNDSGPDFVLSADERQQLEDIFRFAYHWNLRVKSGALFTDFHPVCLANDAHFDSSSMVPYEDLDIPRGREKILCAVTLGLRSSKVPREGEQPCYVWQEKVQVLTGEYFGGPHEEGLYTKALVPNQADEAESQRETRGKARNEGGNPGIRKLVLEGVKDFVRKVFGAFPESGNAPRRDLDRS